MSIEMRYRLSLALEALLWIAALILIAYSLWDFAVSGSLQSLSAFLVIGLLVWWPIFRTRIKHGYWMRDWSDDPERHFSETPRPASGSAAR